MTIDEAIKKLLDKAEEQEYVSQIIVELHREESESEHKAACDACAADHRQLAEWLTNYKEAMRLLKSAIDEWHIVCEWGKCGEYCGWYVDGQCTQRWSGEAEALKLIES